MPLQPRSAIREWSRVPTGATLDSISFRPRYCLEEMHGRRRAGHSSGNHDDARDRAVRHADGWRGGHDANLDALAVVQFVYSVSAWFVGPFQGILQTDALKHGGSVLDGAAVVALIGWTILELIVIAGINIARRER
jgi:hypothetical protein